PLAGGSTGGAPGTWAARHPGAGCAPGARRGALPWRLPAGQPVLPGDEAAPRDRVRLAEPGPRAGDRRHRLLHWREPADRRPAGARAGPAEAVLGGAAGGRRDELPLRAVAGGLPPVLLAGVRGCDGARRDTAGWERAGACADRAIGGQVREGDGGPGFAGAAA